MIPVAEQARAVGVAAAVHVGDLSVSINQLRQSVEALVTRIAELQAQVDWWSKPENRAWVDQR